MSADNTLLLIAAVAHQAWRDAQAGSEEARSWLDTVAPDWREWPALPNLSVGARTDPPARVSDVGKYKPPVPRKIDFSYKSGAKCTSERRNLHK